MRILGPFWLLYGRSGMLEGRRYVNMISRALELLIYLSKDIWLTLKLASLQHCLGSKSSGTLLKQLAGFLPFQVSPKSKSMAQFLEHQTRALLVQSAGTQ